MNHEARISHLYTLFAKNKLTEEELSELMGYISVQPEILDYIIALFSGPYLHFLVEVNKKVSHFLVICVTSTLIQIEALNEQSGMRYPGFVLLVDRMIPITFHLIPISLLVTRRPVPFNGGVHSKSPNALLYNIIPFNQ